jgi:ribosomal protein S18 acetylase RimI-like enzyme
MLSPKEAIMPFQIVPMASEQDMDGKAYVHWKAWQEAYAGLVDSAFLANHTLEKCQAMARRWPDNILLAKTDEGRVIGFVGYGKNRDNDLADSGEIFAIYVLRDYYDKKAGYALMEAGMEKLMDYSRVAVWVLADNARAIRFYERYGFVRDGASKAITLGTPLTEIRLIYERR